MTRLLTMLIAAQVGCATRSDSQTSRYPRVYEYTYEHNTSTLVENHYIVLDSAGAAVSGWYYGTSDDFDRGREGYLPGFFVAPMEDLHVAGDRISFTLRPRTFFAAPVPLQYRDPADIPPDSLQSWTGPSMDMVRSYSGTASSNRVTLDMDRKPRVFVRVEARL